MPTDEEIADYLRRTGFTLEDVEGMATLMRLSGADATLRAPEPSTGGRRTFGKAFGDGEGGDDGEEDKEDADPILPKRRRQNNPGGRSGNNLGTPGTFGTPGSISAPGSSRVDLSSLGEQELEARRQEKRAQRAREQQEREARLAREVQESIDAEIVQDMEEDQARRVAAELAAINAEGESGRDDAEEVDEK